MDIPLSVQEQKRIVGILKGIKFEDLEIHPHYFNKYGQPRHGISLDKAKEIYNQFNKINGIIKRKKGQYLTHAIIYDLSKKGRYFLIFALEPKPKLLLSAYRHSRNSERRLLRRYGLRF